MCYTIGSLISFHRHGNQAGYHGNQLGISLEKANFFMLFHVRVGQIQDLMAPIRVRENISKCSPTHPKQ